MVGRRITTFALLCLAAVSRPLSGQVQDLAALRQGIAQADGRAIITLKSSHAGTALRAPGAPPIAADEMNSLQTRIESDYPVQVQSQLPIIGALVAQVSDADVARLAADPNVAAIEPDWKTYLIASAPAASSSRPGRMRSDAMPIASRAESIPWGVTDVGAPAAWAAGITGAGTKIGIMDTGVDYTHPDLNVVGGYDFTTGSASPSAYNDNQASCQGHGTHVAGIAAAKQNGVGVVGVAPGAALYSLKVFIDYGSGCLAYGSAQIAALQWAVTNHLDVVSISIGNTYSLAYATAVAAANAAGVVVVAAAGNSGAPGVTYPAAYPGTIAVAALDPGNTVASYSSSGPEVWVAAPGSNITSTLPGGGYGDKSGTSMATPHVSGLVALMRQAHPTWTVTQIRNELKSDAINVGVAGFDNNSGWGRVQAAPTGVVPLTLAIAPTGRHASAQQGSAAPSDNAAITLAGTNAGTTAWNATKKKAWLTLTTASGTGSGTVAWTRNTTGLAIGTYVDTVTVSTAATPAVTVFDTLTITAVPTVLAVSPAARSTSVQQGSSAPGDIATVTLTGGNAATTTWTATKKKAWLTLTKASGTGSGTVTWTRNSSGLAAGTYVDTITVSAAGATGSPTTVFDTLKITTAATVLAVSPAGRSTSVPQGGSAPGDNATVTLSGGNAATTLWSATKKKAWLTLTNASGTGSGTVTWTRNSTGLSVGTYVDTITVSAAGATGSPTTVYDTLKITAVPTVLAVSPAARSTSVQQGNGAPGDNAIVTLTGGNAATTTWTATKKQGWLTLTTASGTGSGTVAWTRNSTGLAAGTYVDTITVSAAGATGSPGTIYDTLKITAVPTVLTVSPAARVVTVAQGSAAPGDNATVTLSGGNAATTTWTASKKKAWLTLTTASGTGSGTVTWTRNSTGLAVGTYVDTIVVSTFVGSRAIFDTLKIAAIPVVLAASPTTRSVSVQQGLAAPGDNAAVTLTGTNASTTAWTATKKKAWLTLTTAGGTGSGTVAWTRNSTGLAVGTYVDTITVATAVTGPVKIFDTLTITAAPIPLVVAVTPAARSVSVQQGLAAPGDNASVTLTGTNASSTTWTATKKKTWLTLTTASGTGSGTVAWTRSTAGLAVGTYVDTISVAASGAAGSPALVFDTLKITAAPPPLTVTVAPAARSISVTQGTPGWGDNLLVTLSGANAATATWTASHSAANWEAFVGSAGTGTGYVSWNRNITALAVGVYVDTITVTAPGAVGSPIVAFDTVKITAVITPVTLAVSPVVRSSSLQAGSTTSNDNATITLAGTAGATTAWTAVKHQAWLTLTTASGTGSGVVAWTRSAAGLAVGTYVDTIRVSTAVTPTATIVDTLKITAQPVPIALALSPTGRHATVQQASTAPGDVTALTLTGTGSSTTAWTATRKHSWLTLLSTSGTGSATLGWTRSTAGLAVGTYVDTITVATAVTAPATLYDTLTVTAVPVPIAVALNTGSRSTTVQQGAAAASGAATVTVSGTNSATASWTATNAKAWLILTTPSGIGNGLLAWNHNASGLAVGVYVDTIAVTAGASGLARLVDTLKVTAANVPVVMAVSPASRSLSVTAGQPGWGDNAQVTFTGTDAATTAWTATHSAAPWAAFVSASGVGNGVVAWNRNITTLAVGIYIDTITVRINGSAQSLQVLDSVRITPLAGASVAINPGGRKLRRLTFSGSSNLLAADLDSAVVMASDVDSLNGAGWNATASSPRLILSTGSGPMNGYVRWSRPAVTLAPGMYVDTVVVSLARDASVHGQFVDSLEVVAVTVPQPDAAVSDLFGHTTLSDDQRATLDRQGNNNGRYDLGDFLAWVSRNQIRLSAEVTAKLKKASAQVRIKH